MKPPGQLGDGERNIPIAERSRRNMGATLFHALARIRKDEGVDPDRYPPVKSDIEYDTRRTMIGAEITARETADLILPAIRSTPALASNPSGGRAIKWLLTLILILVTTTAFFSWRAYQQTLITNDLREIARSQAEHLGRAIIQSPKCKIQMKDTEFVIHYKPTLEESIDDSMRIPHKIPPDELNRLDPK